MKPSIVFGLFEFEFEFETDPPAFSAPRSPAFALLLVDTGITVLYANTSPKRYQEEFAVLGKLS